MRLASYSANGVTVIEHCFVVQKLKSTASEVMIAYLQNKPVSLQVHTTAMNTGSLWLGNGAQCTQDPV